MSAPSPNDLFMNVWVSKINSEEMAQPGDSDWDARQMRKYWARVWVDCKELSQHLQSFEDGVGKMQEIMKNEVAVVTAEYEVPEDG